MRALPARGCRTRLPRSRSERRPTWSAPPYSTGRRAGRCARIIRRIPDREITKYRDDLLWLLRHVVGSLDGLTEAELNWRPPAKDANSLLVLATHTLGAAEAHVIQLLAGQEIERVRANEFVAVGDAAPVRARLEDVTRRIAA